MKLSERKRIPASNATKESTDYSIFIFRKLPMLKVWPQIIKPSESATFPTSFQTCLRQIIKHHQEHMIEEKKLNLEEPCMSTYIIINHSNQRFKLWSHLGFQCVLWYYWQSWTNVSNRHCKNLNVWSEYQTILKP